MVTLTRERDTRELKEGEFISVGKRFSGISSNGGEIGIIIENDNSHDILVPNINVRAQRLGRIEKGFNPTIDTSDSNLNFTNKKSEGSHSAPNMNTFTIGDGQTGAITADGDNFSNKHVTAGTATSPGTEAHVGGNILAPGDSIYVKYVNESSNEGITSIDIDFIKMTDGF